MGPARATNGSPTHCLHVDKNGSVWVGGNNDGDQILQFTPDGKLIRQIGKDDGTKGPRSNETTRLNRPAHMFTDDSANELYVAQHRGGARPMGPSARTVQKWVRNIAIDANGNLYTAEVGFGRRAQEFKRVN